MLEPAVAAMRERLRVLQLGLYHSSNAVHSVPAGQNDERDDQVREMLRLELHVPSLDAVQLKAGVETCGVKLGGISRSADVAARERDIIYHRSPTTHQDPRSG